MDGGDSLWRGLDGEVGGRGQRGGRGLDLLLSMLVCYLNR